MRKIIEFPVSYKDACDHLRVEEGDDTSIINRFIKAATSLTENYVEFDIALSEYTVTGTTVSGYIPVKASSFRSVKSVKINGTPVSDSDWEVINIRDYEYTVDIKLDISAESTYEIVYKTGFTSSECDESIRTAIFLKLGELYDIDRSNYTTNTYKTTSQFERILNFHKKPLFR